ncbi:MAG: hypothetical protein AAB535_00545 [Patescibacteria group bacterium]
MPPFRKVPFEQFSEEQRQVLDATQKGALTINASGDIKVGKIVVSGSESRLVGGMIALGVKLDGVPIGQDEREKLLATAQRTLRLLGVDRE